MITILGSIGGQDLSMEGKDEFGLVLGKRKPLRATPGLKGLKGDHIIGKIYNVD